MTTIDLLAHAAAPCSDPDCEIHHPSVIEDDRERRMALAWYTAGALATLEALSLLEGSTS